MLTRLIKENEFKCMNISVVMLLLSVLTLISSCANVSYAQDMQPESRAGWKKIVKWDDDCDEGVEKFFRPGRRTIGVEANKLKSGSDVVKIVCKTGAYNRGVILYIKPKGSDEYKLLEFPQIVPVDQSSKPIKSPSGYYRYTDRLLWGSTNIDTENEKISFRDYFRSGGGCGLYTEYKLADSTPVITLFRARNICDATNPPIKKWRSYSNKEIASWPMGDVPER